MHVIEARNLPAMDLNGLSDPYVKLQLGKHRAKTKVVKKNLNPVWDEEFIFRVGDLNEELTLCVLDEDKYFTDDFLGQVKVPLSKVLDAENLTLGTTWYQLQPKGKKLKSKDCGNIPPFHFHSCILEIENLLQFFGMLLNLRCNLCL